VRADSLAQMLKPGLDDYGLGLWTYSFEAGGRAWRVAKRPGRIMGVNTQLYRLLDRDATIILLGNTNHADTDLMVQALARRMVQP
jgi:D-alanyl-D-alanine carboxypeptidase